MRLVRLVLLAALLGPLAALAQFDHSHAAWDALARKHVRLIDGGKSSQVGYADFAKDRPALKAYLAQVSAVTEPQFRQWTREQRMAFLINAYNAFTVELILTKYPDLKSIRDLGNIVFSSPWKRKFFTLFGRESFLDEVEHEMLRKPGAYDDPRIHFAVNCASIGCPMLREEAYVAARLEAQLEEQARRFLSDRSRNRYNPQSRRLEVSRIFDWYGKDFEQGHRGYSSLRQTFARHADLLADAPADRAAVRGQQAEVAFLDYDWGLNDFAR